MSEWKTKKQEIINLLNLISEISKFVPSESTPEPEPKSRPLLHPGNTYEIIIAGDFNFPYFTETESANDANYFISGFNGGTHVLKTDITLWKQFQKIFGLTSNGNVGVCLKERFTTTLGNDQVWEGKGDKRAYNTDFVGKLVSNKNTIQAIIKATKNGDNWIRNSTYFQHEIITYELTEDKKVEQLSRKAPKLQPYVSYYRKDASTYAINYYKSWLSDHALVYTDIPISVASQSLAPGAHGLEVAATQTTGAGGAQGGGSRKLRRSKHKFRNRKSRTHKKK